MMNVHTHSPQKEQHHHQQLPQFVSVQYGQPQALLNDNKQYHADSVQLDAADSLLLGLEKSMSVRQPPMTNAHWSPEAVGSTFNLQGYNHGNGVAGDIFEPYPLTQPSSKERRSADLKMFLDYVMRPSAQPAVFESATTTPAAIEPIEPIESIEPHPFNDKKRFLHQEPVPSINTSEPPSKRSRICNVSDDESVCGEDSLPKFRDYQEQQWQEQFQGLLEFKANHGHCCVPNTYEPNPTLGRWVKRQRYQYKLRESGLQSTLVASRVQALEDVGFVWDSHAALWEERLNELKQYRLANGHCNVPSSYPKNKQLSTWVKCQRRQFRLTGKGKNSNLTEERIAALDELGFVWDGRTIGNRCKGVVEKTSSSQNNPSRSTIAV
ncbi:unnamed protein product [Cylindrotheca closterium]|uniref:Helicase-associated domain-containing protein n=1 Tax=Cylindrotheca closterium TaxID=2856 RepID=A0AAD2CF31_9STRA|nr:unnamed protein product [Cylindrotheca closterium]